MERAFAVIEAAALALWIGALAAFAFVFAPAAMETLRNADIFGPLALDVIQRLDFLGYVCGAVALSAVFVRNREDATLGRGSALRALVLVFMLLLVVAEAQVIVPAVHAAVHALGAPLTTLGPADPRRASYERLHALSTAVYAVLLGLGCIALAMAVLARPESVRRRSAR